MNSKPSYTVDEIKKKLEYYCVYQDRCHKDVEEKLREFFLIPEAKEEIIIHLIQENYLNEERFAKSFVRGKHNIKKWGRNRIKKELEFRDISAYSIKKGFQEIEEDDYYNTLLQLAEKKNGLLKETNEYQRKQKLKNFLFNKGYEYDLIAKAVKEILE
ncbi:MAG: recombinase RecX [Flavobacteriaceae bacterium]|nr:recombinase RecX [Flavobacteriaceae bacterium]|tara:strand:- start:503787 stop:504260 length:474 start_codon:yes stop_codon:yes gene_type:complete